MKKKIFSIILVVTIVVPFILLNLEMKVVQAKETKVTEKDLSTNETMTLTAPAIIEKDLPTNEGSIPTVLTITQEGLSDNGTTIPTASAITPSPYQLDYQKEELAAFCHFGMNTYTDREWGTGEETPDQFQLTKDFDAETLVKTLQDAGFKRLIVTAKHHDGFCIWNSAYTEHDIASTSYKDGNGDILEEVSAACTKYNMDMGLYLSPWDENADSYGYYDANGNALCGEDGQPKDGMTWEEVYKKDAKDYNEYYKNQIEEIASNPKYGNKGKFVEWWMDGAKGGGAEAQNYDFQSWFNTIQKNEGVEGDNKDDCLLFGAEAKTTVRWIGNESGFANEETWALSKVNEQENTIDSNTKEGYTIGYPDGNKWTVPECDARITPGWFWHKGQSPKTLEALGEMYFKSVGRGATLLLNVPPNTDGTLDKAILERVQEFGRAVKDTFKTNLVQNMPVTASSVRGNDIKFDPKNVVDGNFDTYWTTDDEISTGSLTIDLGKTEMFDVVSIEEYIPFGQRISSFSVEYKNENEEWKEFAKGTTIGAKRLCRSNPVKGNQIRINITGTYKNEVPLISEVGVYKAVPEFSIGTNIPDGVDFIDNTQFTSSSGWNPETGDQYTGGTNMWTNAGEETTFNFTGTTAWLIGTKDPGHGKMKVFIDGQEIAIVNTQNSSRGTKQFLYQTPVLSNGVHNIKLVTIGTIGLEGAYYLNNNGAGMIEIENTKYSVMEGSSLTVKIKRVGGSTGQATVLVNDNPGSAVSGQYYYPYSETLVFEEGETEKEITLQTIDNNTKTGNLNFYLEIYTPTNAILGFNTLAAITFIDDESIDITELKAELDTLLGEANKIHSDYYTPTSFENFVKVRERVLGIANNSNATIPILYSACRELEEALAQLVDRAAYSKEDPFSLPKKVGDTNTVEAEFFILDDTNAASGKEVRISSGNGSNGKHISWFEEGNVIKLPYYASKAGKYQLTAYYLSGRSESNPNRLNWSGENLSSGSLDIVGTYNGEEEPVWDKTTFTVSIAKSGVGEIIFTADEKASPNIDKFDITFVEEIDDKEPVPTPDSEDSILPSPSQPSTAPNVVPTPKPSETSKPEETKDQKEQKEPDKTDKVGEEQLEISAGKNNTIAAEIVKEDKKNKTIIDINIKTEDILDLIEKSDKKINLAIYIPDKQVKDSFSKKGTKEITININIPDVVLANKKVGISEILLKKGILNKAKTSGKDLVITINSEENILHYMWTFKSKDLNGTMQNLNLVVNTKKASNVKGVKKVLKNDKQNTDGIVLNLTGIKKVPASLKVKVENKLSSKTVYIYRYNPKQQKLELVSFGSKVKVNKKGYVEFKIKQSSKYVLFNKKPSDKVIIKEK